MATILVVDDEVGIRALLSEILTDEGHAIEMAENAAQARTVRERLEPDLVLLDIWMPDVDGISLLKEWGACGQLTMPKRRERLARFVRLRRRGIPAHAPGEHDDRQPHLP